MVAQAETENIAKMKNDAIKDFAIESARPYLDILVHELNKANANSYSIGKEKDESVCMTYENGYWIIFIRERGQNYQCGSFSKVEEAVKDLVRRVVTSKRSARAVLRHLPKKTENDNIQVFTQVLDRFLQKTTV